MSLPIPSIALASPCARRAIAIIAAACLAVPAHAQNAKVYVANSANSRILQVQFDPPSTTVVIDDANQLTKIRDIAIRDNGVAGSSLIVCDRNGGRIAFYPNASGTGQLIYDKTLLAGPERPDGMSLDLAGNIFVMNSGQGSSGGISQVWAIKRDTSCPGGPQCVNGGYRAPLGLIDGNVRISTVVNNVPALVTATELYESMVTRNSAGLLQAGDLLVMTNPAALIRYKAADVSAFLTILGAGVQPPPLVSDTLIHPAGASVPLDRQFPPNTSANGMAFSPTGEMLFAMSDGRVLIYGADGKRRSNGAGGFIDFTTGLGQDEFKIGIGLQDGKNRAFITRQQGGELRRFSFQADGTGLLDSVINGFQFPVGVDATNSVTVAAPAGNNVSINASTILSSQIEQVVLPGLINSKVTTFADPREAEQAIPAHLPLHRSLFLNELRADFPPVEIPAWVRAFRLGNPTNGTPSFIIIEAESNVVVAGLLDHVAQQTGILGYSPNCDDPDLTKQPYLFWSPDANDGPIVEGARFIDVSTGCGSVRGMTREMSYFLAGVRVCQPVPTLVNQKIASLRQVINSSCITSQVSRRLNQSLDRAEREFSRARYANAVDQLKGLEAEVLQSPQGFSTCTANTAGEIRARTRSLVFVIEKLF